MLSQIPVKSKDFIRILRVIKMKLDIPDMQDYNESAIEWALGLPG